MSADEFLQYSEEYRAWFERDAPRPAPVMNRAILVSDLVVRRRLHETYLLEAKDMHYHTFTGLAKHFSSTPLQGLDRITFSDMFIQRTHVGRFLLCRIIAPCVRMMAVQTIIEDTDGLVQTLSIYNFPTTIGCSPDHLDKLFPIGTIIAIREPTLKAPSQGSYPLVRVDSPTDIIFIEAHHPILRDITWRTRLPTALPDTLEGWKEQGDAYMKASEWLPAAIAYSRGIGLNPEAVELRLDRSEAYLRLHYYSGALYDARHVLSTPGITDSFRHKALFREAKAEYARGNFHVAEGSFMCCLDIRPKEKSVVDWINRTRSRQVESTGRYDWVSLLRMSKKGAHLDVADYRGPVEVRSMAHRGGGRGIAATRDIEVGELLVVSKPFVAVYKGDVPKRETFLTVDLLSKRMNGSTGHISTLQIIEKIYGNPETHDLVYHLYAGPNFPCSSNSYPPVISSEPSAVDPLAPLVDIDVARIEAISMYNRFSLSSVLDDAPSVTGSDSDLGTSTGLYLLPSLFNHSCASNALWVSIGGVIVVKATEHIPAGTEITLQYIRDTSYVERHSVLKQYIPSGCDCSLCKEELKDGEAAIQRRHELFAKLCHGKGYSVAELRTLEQQLAETYSPARGTIRPMMAMVQHVIAIKLIALDKPSMDIIREELKALENLGFTVLPLSSALKSPIATDRLPLTIDFHVVAHILIIISFAYLRLCDNKNASRWLKAAVWVTNTAIGGGKGLFMVMMAEDLARHSMQEFAKRAL
ncbi:Protein msta, isoform A [Grifola frondosa]|uniref:Protein msta, isoform A n=1 Tax=Grifola frondosa TaxID=5627 RepID=A0A1C7LZF1_GRIFR|nr:Protein msta, isoform A [Grifola frondosa]